ncbi:hypothetical protein PR048_022649 [Dryococelus australis]|uniref:Innexin n=1 Tax=Dryococelus australis TaxID=614101 RepID=A0ABQ9H1P5_9NEOP|nr:hypothetical protein PR048_022649 [Dryococelus australis]
MVVESLTNMAVMMHYQYCDWLRRSNKGRRRAITQVCDKPGRLEVVSGGAEPPPVVSPWFAGSGAYAMLQTFGSLARHARLGGAVSVDNPVFRLHYRATVLFLLASTALVCSRQYVGQHIHCLADAGLPEHVVNTYCFFVSTFTVVRNLGNTSLPGHPGVGPWSGDVSEQPVVRHTYYQWVPFVLFFQALLFYAPHWVWKRAEGGRLAALVHGLEHAILGSLEHVVEVRGHHVPSRAERDSRLAAVRTAFLQRLHINRPWAAWLVLCELLNAVNLTFNIYLLHRFLGGTFLGLSTSSLDIVFPKLTKCIFHKFGPSGSVQNHDALCVMALNIVNEKIYTFLWFWMWFLVLATSAGLLWRLLTFVLHSRSVAFNKAVFRLANVGARDVWSLMTVTRECHFSDWLFLYYLAKNLDGRLFRDLFLGLAQDMSGDKLPEPNHNESHLLS